MSPFVPPFQPGVPWPVLTSGTSIRGGVYEDEPVVSVNSGGSTSGTETPLWVPPMAFRSFGIGVFGTYRPGSGEMSFDEIAPEGTPPAGMPSVVPVMDASGICAMCGW
ncbi:hypothetical protein [Saccharomonospora sp. CUA-673]|uniref:hypothetical protein n=1 Tax=Saccharomonospora sp. CUA-673 TaxID=1904969 RepID=UPI0009F8C47B|nr:hypothetical protein [Saccharomonospora sp. CUA-673]